MEVDIQANSCDLANFQGRLHTGMPGEEASAASPDAPGNFVPGDAAGALLPLAVNALARQSHVRPLAAQLCLNVVPPLVKALRRHRLTPVFEAVGVLRVAVLPGAGVGQLPVALRHPQEAVAGVGVKGQPPGVCKREAIPFYEDLTREN